MTCTNPVYIPDVRFRVPCGSCIGCRANLSQDWTVRLLHESMYFNSTVFLTLTYNNDYLPDDGSLSVRTVQLFVKRLRKSLSGRLIKYFISGEYGENTMRPHYHLILLGVDRDDFNVKREFGRTVYSHPSWTFGHIDLGYVSKDSIRYVTDYMLKGNYDHLKRLFYKINDLKKPFSLKSSGIGKRYALDYADRIKRDMCVLLLGRRIRIPRYYRKILNIDESYYAEWITKHEHELEELYGIKGIIPARQDDSGVQKALNLCAKMYKQKLDMKSKRYL